MSTISDKDKIIENKNDQISQLHAQLQNSSARVEQLRHNQTRLKRKCDDTETAVPNPTSLTHAEKETKLTGEIGGLLKLYYQRTTNKNKAKMVLNWLKSGELFGEEGKTVLNDSFI